MLGKEVKGWALLVLAVLLFPIPVVPGVLMLFGLLALSSRYLWAAKLLAKARKVVPAWIVPATSPINSVVGPELAVSELNI